VAGAQQDAEVVSVDGEVQAKLGFAPAFVPVDPASLGAPDPAAFFDNETGVSNFLSSTADPVEGEETRDGEDVLSSISGTLPGDVVKEVVPTADAGGTFDVTYALTDDDVLRSARITGPFYPGAGRRQLRPHRGSLRRGRDHHGSVSSPAADAPVAAVSRSARLLLTFAAVAVAFAAADTYVVVLALPDMMSGAGLSSDQLQRAAPIVSGFLLG
jgi:hypothetical protein